MQSNHAALKCGSIFNVQDPDATSIVTLQVADKQALLEAQERIEGKGIMTALFEEPAFGMGYSAFATEPVYACRKRKVMSKYKLWTLTRMEGAA